MIAAAPTPAPMSARVDPWLWEALWHAAPAPALLVDPHNRFLAANSAAESHLSASAASLARLTLEDVFGSASRLVDLVARVRRDAPSLAEYGVQLSLAGREPSVVDIQAARVPEPGEGRGDGGGRVLLVIQPRSVAAAMDRSLTAHGATRSLSGLSAMLAHEIKNPLAGISGAAQLIEMSLGDQERELIQIIHEEVERIRLLVERMETFGDGGPIERKPVNLHDVLDQARRSAAAGYARHVRIRESYDPSLPPAPGDRAQLLQAVTNLIKNAAEAAPRSGGEIVLGTAYRPGVKIVLAGGARAGLPLEITVADNGPGVPEELRAHIFEPFVTSKSAGSGLGLALVGKIVADHGGVVECLRKGERTVFRLLLPVWSERDERGGRR